MSKTVIAGILKQEQPYILEWVAYHRMLGFDIIVADNGGNDKTSIILSQLNDAGVITRLDFRWSNRQPQIPAYRAMLRYAKRKGYKFIGFLDCDEFFSRDLQVNTPNPKDGEEFIAEEFSRLNASQLSYHWVCYGGKEQESARSNLVLDRFSYHSELATFFNVNVKSFIRISECFCFANFLYFGPALFSVHYMLPVNRAWYIDGERVFKYNNQKKITHNDGLILHYQVKTWDEYKVKISRGDAALKANKNNREYYNLHNYTDCQNVVDEDVINDIVDEVSRLNRFVNTDVDYKDSGFKTIIYNYLLSFGFSKVAGQSGLLYKVYSFFNKC